MCVYACVFFFVSKDSEAVDSVLLYNLSFLVGKVREMHFLMRIVFSFKGEKRELHRWNNKQQL